jgi:hypothetical protein
MLAQAVKENPFASTSGFGTLSQAALFGIGVLLAVGVVGWLWLFGGNYVITQIRVYNWLYTRLTRPVRANGETA